MTAWRCVPPKSYHFLCKKTQELLFLNKEDRVGKRLRKWLKSLEKFCMDHRQCFLYPMVVI